MSAALTRKVMVVTIGVSKANRHLLVRRVNAADINGQGDAEDFACRDGVFVLIRVIFTEGIVMPPNSIRIPASQKSVPYIYIHQRPRYRSRPSERPARPQPDNLRVSPLRQL